MNILDYVDVDLLQNANKVYFKPYIPMPKMKNVINSFGFEIEPDDIEILIDNTVFGSAKEGIVITNEMLFCKELLKDPFIISLSNIESITVKKNTLSNSLILNDKKSIIDLSQPEYNDLELLFGGINIYLKEINEFNVVDEDEDEVIDERKEWLKEIIENEHLSSQELEDEIEQEDPPKENQNVRQRSFLGKITDGVSKMAKAGSCLVGWHAGEWSHQEGKPLCYVEKTCPRCNKYVTGIHHNYSEWEYTYYGRCDARRQCSHCKHDEFKVVHSHEKIGKDSSNCRIIYRCRRCDDEYLGSAEHDWITLFDNELTVNTSEGRKRKCRNCGTFG